MANLSLYDLNQLMTAQFANFQSQINNKQNTIIFDANTRWFTDLERNKLAGIQSNAEVNQNAYSYIRVGSNTISANSKTDTLEIVAGSNMQLIADISSKQLTISNTYSYTHPATHAATIITQDATHRFVTDTDITNWNAKASTNAVTTTVNGLMIASDKIKLDGIQAGAQVNPTNATIFAAVKGLDGSGSGLDADLLDGKDSTAFAEVGHNHDAIYVSKSSNSVVTGQITFASQFIVNSNSVIANLNADLLDGYNANAFALDGHTHTGSQITSQVANATYATNAGDSVRLGGFESSEFMRASALNSILPTGIIVMWSGASSAIPTGWTLCNGTNGAPDLRDRFILGAGGSYGVGAVGGEATHTLTIDEMPSHTHTLTPSVAGNITGSENVVGGDGQCVLVGATDATGGGQPHNNMPPYYAMCFIMKL